MDASLFLIHGGISMSVKINQNILLFLHRRISDSREQNETPVNIAARMKRQLASIDRAVLNGIHSFK